MTERKRTPRGTGANKRERRQPRERDIARHALEECRVLVQRPSEGTWSQLRDSVATFAATVRFHGTPPERMLVLLKKVLTSAPAFARMLPEVREQKVQELVGLAIEEYYRARPR